MRKSVLKLFNTIILIRIPIRPLGLISGLLCLVMVSSCTVEKQLANTFLKNQPEIDIQLFTPEMVYKYNHKGEDITGFDKLSNAAQDSALYADSRYIQYVSDSLLLDNYINNFIDELRKLGFRVYLDASIDTVLSAKPQAYILNMAQVQLDEYKYPYEDSETIDDSVYYKKFELNGVDLSGWFELSKLNAEKPVKTVLYSTFSSSDGFNGRFFVDPFTYEVRYKYKIDSLEVNDIYELASYAGKKDASYVFDYFMNQYIAWHMPQDEEPMDYYHYNRFRRYISPAGDEKFEVLQSKIIFINLCSRASTCLRQVNLR